MGIKIEMNTSILPIINVGLYQSRLGDLYESLTDGQDDKFLTVLKKESCAIMEQIFERFPVLNGFERYVSIQAQAIVSPKYYNYDTDRFDFILCPNEEWNLRFGSDSKWLQEITNFCIQISEKRLFFKWCQENFGSYDGFISCSPVYKEDYLKALRVVNTDMNIVSFEFSRALALAITYNLTHNKEFNIDSVQKEFEHNVATVVEGGFDFKE